MKHTQIKINPLLYIVWTVFIVADQAAPLLYAFLGAAIHECAHIGAFTAYGAALEKVEILPFGISVKLRNSAALDCRQEMVCAAAGPLANIVCALILICLKPLPNLEGTEFFFYCNIALCAVNCMPVLPLDGGRILYFGLLQHLPIMSAKKISVAASFVLLVPMFLFAFIQTFRTGNISVLLIALYLLIYLFTSPDTF